MTGIELQDALRALSNRLSEASSDVNDLRGICADQGLHLVDTDTLASVEVRLRMASNIVERVKGALR